MNVAMTRQRVKFGFIYLLNNKLEESRANRSSRDHMLSGLYLPTSLLLCANCYFDGLHTTGNAAYSCITGLKTRGGPKLKSVRTSLTSF
jgi:hypothetical protein